MIFLIFIYEVLSSLLLLPSLLWLTVSVLLLSSFLLSVPFYDIHVTTAATVKPAVADILAAVINCESLRSLKSLLLLASLLLLMPSSVAGVPALADVLLMLVSLLPAVVCVPSVAGIPDVAFVLIFLK